MESSNKRMTVIVAVFVVLVVGASTYFIKDRSLFDKIINQIRGQKSTEAGIETPAPFPKTPEGFPADIPIEKIRGVPPLPTGLSTTSPQIPTTIEHTVDGLPAQAGEVRLEQGYTRDYPGQKQRTIVFLSDKSIIDNQKIYTDYLMKNKWAISNNLVDNDIVSFYAKRESTEINIVIISDSNNIGKSKISISVLETLK